MKSILLIEDNLLLAENIISLLEEESFNVFHASDCFTGTQYAFENTPDLILCDIMLPDKDGFELFKMLNEKENYTVPPFIYLTAKSLRQDQRKGMELGADDYITKPFTQQELLGSINTQIKKREAIVENTAGIKDKIKKMSKADGKAKKNEELSINGFIFLNKGDSPGFYPIKKIVYIKSMKDYTQIYFHNSPKMLIRKTLAHWENVLPSEFFVRIHRQTIINLDFVDKVEKDKNYTFKLYLRNIPTPLDISQRYGRKIKQIK